jgi:ribosomal protein S12 methylthiotransferase accessory factor
MERVHSLHSNMGSEHRGRIGIIELGQVGVAALRAMLDAGLRDFVLADTRTVAYADLLGDTVYRRSDVGRCRVDAVIQQLSAPFPDARFELGAGPEQGPLWSEGWLGRCALCLLACDAASESVALNVNAICLAACVPLVAGLTMGNLGQVGPVIRGGEGPCLRCLDLRVRATAGRPAFPPAVYPDRSIAERVGRALAELTLHVLNSQATQSEVVYLWPPNELARYEVLSSTLCADCSRYVSPMSYRYAAEFDYRERPHSDSRHILSLAERLVNPVAGPIRTLQRFEPGDHAPPLKHWVADLADPGWLSFGRSSVYCGGSALEDDVARAAALGEAVERAVVCPPNYGELPVASYSDIVDDALDPLLWDLYTEETRNSSGFPYVAPSHAAPTTWSWGYSLTEARPVMVPASRVFSPLRPSAPGDFTDGPIISGCATGNTLEEATLSGLYETLERDAFMIAWANRLPLKLLRLGPYSRDQVGQYLAAFDAAGIEVRCFSLSLDLGANVVISIARSDRQDQPASVVAAAADVDIGAACRRALKELSANRLTVQYEMMKANSLPDADFQQVLDETAHGLLYARRDMIPLLDFWWDTNDSIDLPPAPPAKSVYKRLRDCVENIRRAGLHVVAIDLTPPEFRSMGLWTVKTLVPGTYPMNFDERWRHLGGARIRSAPVTAGLRSVPLEPTELNHTPHPFP